MTILSTKIYPEQHRNVLRPLTGWVLEHALVLDEAAPGFLRMTCTMKAAWQQSFAGALAGALLDNPTGFLERATGEEVRDDRSWRELLGECAELLPVLRPREIVEASLGTCPDGFLGALDKLGYCTMSAGAYVRLLDVFTSMDQVTKARRRLVLQSGNLDEDRLDAIDRLHPSLLHPSVLRSVTNAKDADNLNQLLVGIRACCRGATDEAIGESLKTIQATGPRRWARNWLAKSDQGAVSLVIEDPDLEVVTPGTAQKHGLEFHNCLRSMSPRMIGGTWAAAVYHPEKLILIFQRLDGGDSWLLSGVFADRNGHVPAEKSEAARRKVLSLGDGFALLARPPAHLRALAEVLDPFGLENLDLLD